MEVILIKDMENLGYANDIVTVKPGYANNYLIPQGQVIADFNACEQMMRGLIKKVNMGNRFFSPSLRMVIGVPSGSTEVELRAVRDSAEHAGGRDVYLIFEPMAAAIGIASPVDCQCITCHTHGFL